jgi:hypothetical protein
MNGPAPARSHALFYATLAGLFIVGTIYAFAHEGGLSMREPNGAFSFETLGVLVATGLTLCLYSFLYEDNAFFKAAEHLYVGVGLGYQIVLAWFEYIKPEAYSQLLKYAVRENVPGHPEWALIPALVLSALLLARFVPQLSWMSRVPVAVIVGFTAATQATNYVQANVLKQIEETIAPLSLDAGVGPLIGQLVILVGVVTVLLYFFFSIEHRGPVGLGSRIGMWFLMVAFGASYGYTVMGRMALLVGRIHFLLFEWLKVPKA